MTIVIVRVELSRKAPDGTAYPVFRGHLDEKYQVGFA